MVVSADGAHVNGAYEATASTVYTFDEEMATIVTTVNDALYRFGTRNDKTYTTVGPVQVDRGNFYCQFYIEQAVTDPTEPSDPTEPVEDDVLTIAEAIAMGTAMEHNTYTEEKYKVTGLIKEVYSEQYGNMRLVDEAGNILTLYGTWSADGSVGYSQMEVKPVAGDTITIYGPVGQYNGVAQIKNGWIVEHIPAGSTPTEPTEPTTPDVPENTMVVVDAPEAGVAYKFGMIQESVSMTDVYYLMGGMNGFYMATSNNVENAIDVYLEETEGGYYFYTMDGENKLYINMVVSADGAHVNGAYEATASTVYTYDEEMDTIVTTVNDALYRFGTRNDKSYTTIGPVQVEKGNFFCRFYGEKEATDPTEPAEGVLTIAEAIAMGSAMEHNTYTEEKYKVTGVIESVYQTTYGNMRLVDEAGNVLTIYGTWSADGSIRYDALEVKPVAGDTVTIYGPVGNYDGAAQIKNGWIVEHIPGEPSESDPAEEPDAVISFADVANRVSLSLEQQVWKQNGITVTNDKAASTTDVADYANPARFYKNSKLTIAANGMTKIVVTCNAYKDYATALVDSIPAAAGVTVTKDGNVVVIEFASAVNSFVIEALSAGQVRVDSIGIFN